MSIKFSNIRDFKVMYLSTMIGESMQYNLSSFNFIEDYFSDKNLSPIISKINFRLKQ